MIERIRAFLLRRTGAYRTLFKGPVAEIVLEDLAKFCRANESTFLPDPRAHAVLEGRREVWLRIRQHIDLTDEQIMKRFGGE